MSAFNKRFRPTLYGGFKVSTLMLLGAAAFSFAMCCLFAFTIKSITMSAITLLLAIGLFVIGVYTIVVNQDTRMLAEQRRGTFDVNSDDKHL